MWMVVMRKTMMVMKMVNKRHRKKKNTRKWCRSALPADAVDSTKIECLAKWAVRFAIDWRTARWIQSNRWLRIVARSIAACIRVHNRIESRGQCFHTDDCNTIDRAIDTRLNRCKNADLPPKGIHFCKHTDGPCWWVCRRADKVDHLSNSAKKQKTQSESESNQRTVF